MSEASDAANVDDRVDELFERAQRLVEELRSTDDRDGDSTVALLDDLGDVVDETVEVLETVDLTELAGAVNWTEVPEAFEREDVLDAVHDDDSAAVTLRKLLTLVNLGDLWEAVDGRELWREKRELEDEVDDLTDDGNSDTTPSVAGEGGGRHADLGALQEFDPTAVENAVQARMSDAVGDFRRTLLDAHDRLAAVRERNAQRFSGNRRRRSRNPTAVSTLSAADVSSVPLRYSTVPEETRYSTAPNRRRIYGPRFNSAGGGDDE